MDTIGSCSQSLDRFREELWGAEAVVVGAGSGLSAASGLTYSGERFLRLFGDFREAYGIEDMYTGGFYPFPAPEVFWAWWSRHIYWNRYAGGVGGAYTELRKLLEGKNYFVITTNVDHCFQRAGFDKERLFYTQGDYGLFQCSVPCCQRTFDNEKAVRQMVERQREMRVPTELLPRCPVCGSPMTLNLRTDASFVEDGGWRRAKGRYEAFLRENRQKRVLFWELGVGCNTPGIIKYPFWRFVWENPKAVYACVNLGEARAPREIARRSILINGDIAGILKELSGAEPPLYRASEGTG